MTDQKSTFHTRSISLPSPRPTTSIVTIEDHLHRLKSSLIEPSSTSSSIYQNLCNTKHMYEHLNNYIHLPYNQQTLSKDSIKGNLEHVLEGSLVLLDISSLVLEALSQMKESILELESALRRGNNSKGIETYMISRKKIGKNLSKGFMNIKKAETFNVVNDNENNTLRMLMEAESISMVILRYMISYLMGKKDTCHARGWSMVAKLIKYKDFNKGIEDFSDIEGLDCVLCVLSSKNSCGDMKVLLNQLETLELGIDELYEGMDCVSRCIIKTRVSLLNVLN